MRKYVLVYIMERVFRWYSSCWQETVAEQFYPHIRPQENGTKSDIRWRKVLNISEFGLMFVVDKLFRLLRSTIPSSRSTTVWSNIKNTPWRSLAPISRIYVLIRYSSEWEGTCGWNAKRFMARVFLFHSFLFWKNVRN